MLFHDVLDILFCDGSEIPVPGKVLPDQSIGNLTWSSFPGTRQRGRTSLVVTCSNSVTNLVSLVPGELCAMSHQCLSFLQQREDRTQSKCVIYCAGSVPFHTT